MREVWEQDYWPTWWQWLYVWTLPSHTFTRHYYLTVPGFVVDGWIICGRDHYVTHMHKKVQLNIQGGVYLSYQLSVPKMVNSFSDTSVYGFECSQLVLMSVWWTGILNTLKTRLSQKRLPLVSHVNHSSVSYQYSDQQAGATYKEIGNSILNSFTTSKQAYQCYSRVSHDVSKHSQKIFPQQNNVGFIRAHIRPGTIGYSRSKSSHDKPFTTVRVGDK